MKLLPLALLGLLVSAPASAQPPEKTTSAIVYGDEACPEGSEGEIVVCGRRDESERYRIPKELREDKEKRPDEIAWGARNRLLDDAARETMPGSCSVVGSYGQSGCRQQMLRQWGEERMERKRRSGP
jgi:hypothetical protein